VSGTVARWVLLMAFLLAGCRSWFVVVRRVSFLLHKDRGQVPVVNGEEEVSPHSYPLRVYPLGTSCLRRSETSPKVVRTSLPSRLSPKCRSPHLIASHHLEEAVLDQQKSSATGPAKNFARRCDGWTFSAARPERGRGRRARQRSLLVV
jgi:hypothetical protein